MAKNRIKLTAATLPPVGTVYAVTTPQDNHGVVRVIANKTPFDAGLHAHEREYAAFVAVTKCHSDPPDHARIREVYVDARGFLSGVWVASPAPPEFRVIDVLQPTEGEKGVLAPYVSAWSWLIGEVDRREGPKTDERRKSSGCPTKQLAPAPGRIRNRVQAESDHKWFDDWEQYHSKELVSEVKGLIQSTIGDLRSSTDKGHKSDIIVRLAQSLKDLDKKVRFLNTIERDDLAGLLESLAEPYGLDGSAVEYATRVLNTA